MIGLYGLTFPLLDKGSSSGILSANEAYHFFLGESPIGRSMFGMLLSSLVKAW